MRSGEVRCWGGNGSGQLGDGTTTPRPYPVVALQSPGGPALANVQTMTLGARHSCALLRGGDLQCWGANYYGQVGDGTGVDRLNPVFIEMP